MPKYRKKPVVIEAFRYSTNPDDKTISVPKWYLEAVVNGVVFSDGVFDYIRTLESPNNAPLRIDEGDYVIKGIKNELYPCKPDIFAATYELVEE